MIKLNSKIDGSNIEKIINIEINSLSAQLTIQKNMNSQLLIFLKDFFGNAEVENNLIIPNDILDYMSISLQHIKNINYNITSLNKFIKELNKFKTDKQLKFEDLSIKVNEYNLNYNNEISKIHNTTSDAQNFINSLYFFDMSEYIFAGEPSTTPDAVFEIVNNATETSPKRDIESKEQIKPEIISNTEIQLIENTLVISYINEKVILPYKIKNLEEELKNSNNKYTSISQIIDELYTIPIENYKFSPMSRFKEAYKLIIEKEKGSKADALHLASELLLNFNLHPAIITACKNLNELDIYLSCLEYDELEDFNLFEIKFEAAPMVRNKTELISKKLNLKNKPIFKKKIKEQD